MALPHKPILRGLEPTPIQHEGRSMLLLRDPSGVSDAELVISRAAVAVLRLFDGEHTIEDIQASILKDHGTLLEREQLEALVRRFDDAYFLEGATFDARKSAVEADYRNAARRPFVHSGIAYPDDPLELRAWFEALNTVPEAKPREGARLCGAAVPHIDLRFGGASNACAHRLLAAAAPLADTVIVLGTGHKAIDDPFTLTRVPYATPLADVPNDLEFVDALAARIGPERAYRAELLHREEHSIEFQAIFVALRNQARDRPLSIVPVLVGSFHEFIERERDPIEDDRIATFVGAARDEAKRLGRNVLVVSSIDLAHLGPRYGDPTGLDPDRAHDVEVADRELLEFAARGDAGGFFEHNAACNDERRICGFSALYTQLRILRGARGTLLRYDQTTFPGSRDTVSHCSMVFEAP
ncbi:MAG: AmmeMemoRadiSam system protein B [Planctomycetes bacterium]|nr:AmmeMemoRadiSam system protein B [Planctomycetota bacterium]